MMLHELLSRVKKELSNKEVWEKYWESNKLSGYSSGSLMNSLGGLYTSQHRMSYPAGYVCVARAIRELYQFEIDRLPIKAVSFQLVADWEFQPSREDILTVRSFQEIKNHEYLMNVLDLAIRYAKIWIFS